MKNADGCECIDSNQFVLVNHLGINPLERRSPIFIFPNPNKGVFTIRILDIPATESFILNIMDQTGRILNTNKLNGNKDKEVSYSYLSNGIYTLEIIKNSGERYFSKLHILK